MRCSSSGRCYGGGRRMDEDFEFTGPGTEVSEQLEDRRRQVVPALVGLAAGATFANALDRAGRPQPAPFAPRPEPNFGRPRPMPMPRPRPTPGLPPVGFQNGGCRTSADCSPGFCYLGSNGANFCSNGNGQGSLCQGSGMCPFGTSCQFGVCVTGSG